MTIGKKFYITSPEATTAITKDNSVLITVGRNEEAESCVYRIQRALGSNFFIRHMIFRCNGSPGFLQLGRQGLVSSSLRHFQILRSRFAVTPVEVGAAERSPEPRIILNCGNVGDGEPGRNFMRTFANATGVPVRGGYGLRGQQTIIAYPGGSTLINHGATYTYTL